MFCPKCAAKNDADLDYCRACGENLKVISQVMEGHAPLAIASKLDAVFEKKTERLRRDSIWWGIWAAIVALWALTAGSFPFPTGIAWVDTLGLIAIPVVLFLLSGWKFAAYRRSRETGKGEAAPPDLDDSSTSGPVYCVSCGGRNAGTSRYCKSCGQGMAVGKRGLEKYLPAFLIDRLDMTVAKNEQFALTYKTFGRIGLVSGAFLLNAVMQLGFYGPNNLFFFYSFIFLSTSIIATWDLITYRRNLEPEEFAAFDDSNVSGWQEFRAFSRKPEIKSKLWIVAIFLLFSIASPFVFESRGVLIGFPLVTLIAAGALILNFKQFQSENPRRRMQSVFELPNRELTSNETQLLDSNLDSPEQVAAVDEVRDPDVRDRVRFASMPSSVTEDTTRALTALSEPFTGESLTTNELKNRNDEID